MSDLLATGRIDIDLNDKDAVAGLRALDAQFDRTMRSIEGKEAEVNITANLKDLKRDLKKAEAMVEGFDKKIADLEKKRDATSGAARETVNKKLSQMVVERKALEKMLPSYRQRAEYVEQHVESLKRTNRQVELAARKEGALEKAVVKSTKATEAQAAARQKANDKLQAEGRLHARALTEDTRRTQGSIANERAALRMRSEAAAMDRRWERERITAHSKEQAAVARLQQQYAALYEQHQRAERSRGKAKNILSPAATQRINVGQAAAVVQMEALRKELQVRGAMPITQHVDLKLNEERTGSGIFANFAKGISDTAIRVGPLTTSLAGLTKTLLILGPVVTGIIGHLGALVAVTGSAAYGAFGVASAAAAGFGISLLGVGLVMPKLLNDFKNLNSLQDAYHKQVLKTGANSEKAKTKLKEFEHALGEVPPTTLKTFQAMDKLSEEWGKFTNTLRPQFYEALGQSIDTVSHHMTWFKQNTTTAFTEITKGWNSWMKRLRSDSAGGTLATLGDNANASIKPLMSGLGNLAAAFGRMAASFSRWLPELLGGFDQWSGRISKSTQDTEALDKRVDNAVRSMRAFGGFVASLGRWLIAFFAPGVQVGTDSLDKYSDGLDKATAKMKTDGGRSRLVTFFQKATETSEKFIKAMTPFAQLFYEWTTIMRPFTDILVTMVGALGNVTEALLSLGAVKFAAQVVFGVFLGGKLLRSIVGVGSGLWNIVKALGALKAAGGIGAALKGGIIRFATGGAVRGMTPANPLFVMNVGPGGGGGVPGKGGKGAPPIVGGLGKLGNLRALAGPIAAVTVGLTGMHFALKKIADSRNAEKNNKQLQALINARNINGIKSLQKEYEKFGKTPPPNLQKGIDEIRRLNNMDVNKLANNVRQNWGQLTSTTKMTFSEISRFASRQMKVIRDNTKGRSEEAQKAATANFKQASRAIKTAIDDGRVHSSKGMAQIRKLWREVLQTYGFSEKQARNVQQGQRPDGGKEEGQTGATFRARGGIATIGNKGERGRDNVPAMLNGQPSVVARGEQVAVFNSHQQRAMNQMHPGGLEGFFARNGRPHHMTGGGIAGYAKGGIIPVPGFPGESAAASVVGLITKIAQTFRLVLTDAFGQGHKSPGHTVTGTAADFSGPDANMGRAVSWLTSKGFLVGYDGTRGSQDWPGHGPSTRTSNYHLHVELGGGAGNAGGLGAILGGEAPKIKIPKMLQGLGNVSVAGQAALDTSGAAAQASLDNVLGSIAAPVEGGGGGVGGGKAASRSQMTNWARRALTTTKNLGHGGPTSGNISKLLTLAMKESSWITDSINNWDINAKAGNPSGGLMHVTIDKVGGSKAALFDPVTNMIASIVYQMARYKSLITFSPYAKGGLVGERGKEIVADHKTGGIKMVNQPTIMGLSDSQAVIPKGAAGAPYMESLAKSMGIPAFDKGRQPNMNQGAGNTKTRGSKNKKKRKAMNGWQPEKLPSVKRYRQLEASEDALNARIDILDREVREPEDLVIKSGKDANGDDLYVENTAEINRYRAELDALIGAQKQMYGPGSVLEQLRAQFAPAITDLNQYREVHERSKSRLKEAIAVDQAIIAQPLKGPNKKALKRQQEKARKRIEKNRGRLEIEKTALEREGVTRGDLREDNKDLKERRWDTARLDLEDQQRIQAGLAGRVGAALESSNPQASDPTADADTGLSYQGQRALTDALLAGIQRDYGSNFNPNVQGIPGGAAGPGGAQGMHANPAQLGGLAGAGRLAAGAGGVVQGGSLAAGASGSVAAGNKIGAMEGMEGVAKARRADMGGMTTGGMSGAVGKTVNITNHFQTQPADPLTWSKGVEFEAGAAI